MVLYGVDISGQVTVHSALQYLREAGILVDKAELAESLARWIPELVPDRWSLPGQDRQELLSRLKQLPPDTPPAPMTKSKLTAAQLSSRTTEGLFFLMRDRVATKDRDIDYLVELARASGWPQMTIQKLVDECLSIHNVFQPQGSGWTLDPAVRARIKSERRKLAESQAAASKKRPNRKPPLVEVVACSVWITGGGTRYHRRMECNALTFPRAMALSEGRGNTKLASTTEPAAKKAGYEPCAICFPMVRGTRPKKSR